MLREIKSQKNNEGDLRKRWFNAESMDLIVWLYSVGNLQKFQLCYDKIHNEHALTWIESKGFIHDSIDDGESIPGGHKSTPILVPDGAIDALSIVRKFSDQAGAIDNEISEFITSKLLSLHE
ncbi:MAG: hypothetical protein GKR91_07310 [Pseudomonadales bacterium]|nr:hypothetical protein [Pseudomonadales bacterium]